MIAGFVQAVDKEPMAYTASAGGLPGLTPEETAILAGILTALATFLFLLIPILCCLCPLCAGCGKGKKKSVAVTNGAAGHRNANLARYEPSVLIFDYLHLVGKVLFIDSCVCKRHIFLLHTNNQRVR